MQSSPDHLIVVTGFGNKGIDLLVKELEGKLPLRRTDIISGCPTDLANLSPDELVDRIAQEKSRIRAGMKGSYLDVDDSYGALLNLADLVRGRISEVSHVFLIDGPLSPHVTVSLPETGVFDVFRRQYDERPAFARRTLDAFRDLPSTQRAKFTTVGSRLDTIVPSDAKLLPGVGHHLLDLEGHSLTPEKIQAVTAIITRRVMSQSQGKESQRSRAY